MGADGDWRGGGVEPNGRGYGKHCRLTISIGWVHGKERMRTIVRGMVQGKRQHADNGLRHGSGRTAACGQ